MSHYVVPSYTYFTGLIPHTYPGDPDFPEEEGRHGGIKVARVLLADALNSQAYRSFYEDPSHNQFWNPSVPDGFTKEMTTTYMWGVKGPMATNIMGEETEGHQTPERFSVAKVTGTDYYLGVYDYEDEDDRWIDGNGNSNSTLKVSLRYSRDLVHWSDNKVIYSTHDWTTTHFNYPIFLSSDGWSNNAVDPNDFYIVGTSPSTIGHTVYRLHVTIPPPPPPPVDPPPPPVCYDNNGNIIDCYNSVRARTGSANGTGAVLDESSSGASYVYPNPGHGMYTLNYVLNDHATTQLNVLDVTGRRLQTGSTVTRGQGRYTESVNISGHAKGIYFLELLVNGSKKTFKVIYQ
jgi:hypothetical protein